MKNTFEVFRVALLVACVAGVAFAEDAWVQTDGTQYVDTGVIPTPNTKVVADFAYQAVTPTQQRVFGVSGAGVGLSFASYINGGGNYAWALQDNDGNWASTDVKVTTDRRRLTLDGPGNLVKLETRQSDGTWADACADRTLGTVRTQNGRYPIYLFANNQDGKSVLNRSTVRLYGLKLYENGELVRDYVPLKYGTVGVLSENVSGERILPTAGHPFVCGGDIEVSAVDVYRWSGASGAAWGETANWTLDNVVAPRIPTWGDKVWIDTGAAGSTVTVSLAGFAARLSELEITGAGTAELTDLPCLSVADRLTVAAGATVRPSGTLYVAAATVAGADLTAALYTASADWIAGDGMVNVSHAGSSVVDDVLVLDVAEGQSLTYSTQLAATLTKVVKTGPGTAVVSNDANASFTGVTEVRGGVLEIQSAQVGIIPTLGNKKANTVTVFAGAQLHVRAPGPNDQGDKRFNNRFIIAGAGPDGTGALRFTKASGGIGNCDSMFSEIVLAGDAHVSSAVSRFGFGGNGMIDLGGHTLDLHPNSQGGFMINGATWTNGHIRASGSMNPVAQNSNTFSGGSANTFTLESGVTFGFWNAGMKFDWTLVAKGGSSLSLGAGTSHEQNNLDGPIELTDGTVYLRTYSPSYSNLRQHLKGKIAGAGRFQKEGNTFVFLDNASNDGWTGGVVMSGSEQGGLVLKYPGSLPAAAPARVSAGVLAFDGANWQGPDVKALAERATYGDQGFIAPYLAADGTYTLTEDFDAPVRLGAWNAGTFDIAGRLADASRLANYGATLKVSGDNDGLVLGGFSFLYGTTVVSGTGYINITNSLCRIGATNNTALCRVTVKDGGTFARFVPSTGGNANSTRDIRIQDGGSKGAVLEVLAGGSVTNKVNVGDDVDTLGALWVDGGSVCNLSRNSNDGSLGGWGYGYTGVYGGVYDIVGWLGVGRYPGGVGVFEQTGGRVILRSQGFAPSRGGTARVRFSGGTFTGASDYIRMAEQQWGWKGVTSGTAVLTVDGDAQVEAVGIAIVERTNAYTSVVNFNGGVFKGAYVRKSDWNVSKRVAEARGYIGFNGGVFRATADDAGYFPIFGSGVRTSDCVRVYAGGAKIDTNGKRVTNGAVPFTAPTGKGVAKITIPSGTTLTGQIGSPEVVITGDGQGASAWCTFDRTTGTVGEIVVTSPGWGYTTASATIRLGNRKTAVTCPVTLADNVATGGLTVMGRGVFSLQEAGSTYGGETFVTNATLCLKVPGALPAASPVRLAEGTLDLNGGTHVVKSVGGSGLVANGTLQISDTLAFDAATAQDRATNLVFTAAVDLPETVTITNVEALDPSKPMGTLCTFAAPQTKAPQTNLPSPWVAVLTDGGRTLRFGYQHATVFILR